MSVQKGDRLTTLAYCRLYSSLLFGQCMSYSTLLLRQCTNKQNYGQHTSLLVSYIYIRDKKVFNFKQTCSLAYCRLYSSLLFGQCMSYSTLLLRQCTNKQNCGQHTSLLVTYIYIRDKKVFNF